MESKFMKFVNKNKGFVVFLLIWTFIHIVLLIEGRDNVGFWPFDGITIRYYGFVEFFVYETLPILIFIIFKLLGLEIKFIKFVNKSKWFVLFFLIWTFIHIVLLKNGWDYNGFWPFDGITIKYYGFDEFFIYESLPILIFIIFKLLGKDTKKTIDENN